MYAQGSALPLLLKTKEGRGMDGRVWLQKDFSKSVIVSITSNFTIHTWSIKCRQKKKLIAQFGRKLRDERFEPN